IRPGVVRRREDREYGHDTLLRHARSAWRPTAALPRQGDVLTRGTNRIRGAAGSRPSRPDDGGRFYEGRPERALGVFRRLAPWDMMAFSAGVGLPSTIRSGRGTPGRPHKGRSFNPPSFSWPRPPG